MVVAEYSKYRTGEYEAHICENMYGDLCVELYVDSKYGLQFLEKYISWCWTECESLKSASVRLGDPNAIWRRL